MNNNYTFFICNIPFIKIKILFEICEMHIYSTPNNKGIEMSLFENKSFQNIQLLL